MIATDEKCCLIVPVIAGQPDPVDCRKCGANLDLPDSGEGVATCPFCGTEHLLPTRSAPHAPDPRPVLHQTPAPRRPHRRPVRRSALPVVLASVGSIAGIGVAIAVLAFDVNGAVQGVSGVGTPGAGAGSSVLPDVASADEWQSGACMLDGNGDDVLDFAGLRGPDEGAKAVVVDGSTGESIFSAGSFSYGDEIFCPTEGWIGVADDEAFRVDLFQITGSEAHVTHVLPDEPERWGTADGCVNFHSDDGRNTGIALPDGTVTECRVRPRHRFRVYPGMEDSITRSRYVIEEDGVRYTLHERQRGTEFLEISAHQRRQLWKITTRFLRAGGSTGALAMALAPGTLVAFGSERRDDEALFAIGLDAQTGIERWERRLPTGPAVSLRSVHFNGRFVVYSELWNDALIALDPTTGQTAWQVGGR